MMLTDAMRREVEDYLGLSPENGIVYLDELYSFYYRCMAADMHYADADRYAILNTMFNYDIGMDNARAIDGWMYEHDEEIYELNPAKQEDKAKVALAVAELGLNLDFSGWINAMYEEYKFFESEDNVMNDRINAIASFAQRRDAEIENKKKQADDREEFLKQTILGWSDRIQQLIDTANACVKHGIKFWHDSVNNRKYDGNYFVTDGCCHILGFEFNRHRPSTITRIGKEGGGCCHFNVFTDGKTIEATGDGRLWALEEFVKRFDEFETKFYAYIDKICASK